MLPIVLRIMMSCHSSMEICCTTSFTYEVVVVAIGEWRSGTPRILFFSIPSSVCRVFMTRRQHTMYLYIYVCAVNNRQKLKNSAILEISCTQRLAFNFFENLFQKSVGFLKVYHATSLFLLFTYFFFIFRSAVIIHTQMTLWKFVIHLQAKL